MYINRFFVFIPVLISVITAAAQDSTRVLQEVQVQAYQYDRPLNEVPAAVGYVSDKDLYRFSNTSLLPAVNTIAGVRMEERSPGSYRFSIRGSLLRSPFGVRNVKVYWNGLPLTDGGGNTYLNLIDFASLGSVEVIKGPGGSLYGAGTGGVVLLNSAQAPTSGLQMSAVTGSYGLQRFQVGGQLQGEKARASVQFAHQESDGYREQSAMRRDAANVDLSFDLDAKNTLSATVFYTDLFYETPGGLNKTQFEEDPDQARPATPVLPGAVEQNASVRNKTVYGGISHEYQWNANWSTRTGLYGSYTDFDNSAIANYESRRETNVGGRMENQYKIKREGWKGKITFGGEYQYFSSPVDVYDNDQGSPAARQLDDDLTSGQLLIFAQGEFDLPLDFYLTVGASANFLQYDFGRTFPTQEDQQRDFDPEFSPRIALLKKIVPAISVYGSVSSGFSPPSLAEVRPSDGIFRDDLDAERGINYELGVRGKVLNNKLSFDLTGYDFRLEETIVIRRTDDGADYFINAGRTKQRGMEAVVAWDPIINQTKFITHLRIWGSYTYNHYRFKGQSDYSGNSLTGVAPTVAVAGIDISTRPGLYVNITANYTDHIPLNDANSEFSKPYSLLGARVGYHKRLESLFTMEIFAGVDNVLDERYSLGNDLNAFGGRYYNAAAPRNYYIGLKATGIFGKE